MAKVFTGFKNFIKRHKKLTIFLVIVLILAVIIVSCVSSVNRALAELTGAPPDVTVLTRADLENIVTATGTLESTDIRQVTTTQTAEVQEIHVAVGDFVQAGDLLCVLDSTALDKDIAYMQENVNDTKAQDSLSMNQAQRNLNDAREQYNSDKSKYDNDVSSAKRALDDLVAQAENDAELQSGRAARLAEHDTAFAAWEAAQQTYDASAPEYHTAWAAYDAAWKAYEQAQRTYDATYAAYAEAIAIAQQAYDGAITARDSANRGNEQTVKGYQDAVDTRAITDSTKSLQNQLQSLLDQKDEMTIYAPISGTVTAINAEVGVSAAGFSAAATGTAGLSSGLFEIQNLQRMQVVTSVAEYDVVDVAPGLPVRITSDAVSGESWQGVVSSVSPVAIDAAANFEVVITVTSDPGALTPGMSARMNIIVDSRENVFSVPFDAVVANESGQQVVYVYEATGDASAPGGATTREVVVETGLESDYYIEIISSELSEGMQILNDPLGVNVNQAFDFGITIG